MDVSKILGELRQELDLHYDDLQKGILHFYTSETEFAAAREPARLMREHGCDVALVDAEEVVRIEPALRFARAKIVGGSMTYSDESDDACVFTRKRFDFLAISCRRRSCSRRRV